MSTEPSYMIEPEYRDIYFQWQQARTQETNRKLIAALDPYIKHAVIAAGGDAEDLVTLAKAQLMTLYYMPKYDPMKSTLQNYLYGSLRGLSRVVGKQSNIIQVPEAVVLDRKKLTEAEQQFVEENGYHPSTQELADMTGMSTKRIESIRTANVPTSDSQVEALQDTPNAPSSSIPGQDIAAQVWQEYVYDSLTPRQQAVMERLYGMHGYEPTPAKDVAKELEISNGAVSQHRKKIDEALASDDQYSVFGDKGWDN